MGFSIEMSVTNQVLGKHSKHSTQLQVPFLNLMANIKQRALHSDPCRRQYAGVSETRRLAPGQPHTAEKSYDDVRAYEHTATRLHPRTALYDGKYLDVGQCPLDPRGPMTANEPDLYVQHRLDVTGRAKQLLVTPNIAYANWSPEQVWDTGFVDNKYPTSNCGAVYHDGEAILDPQTVFPDFLTHDGHVQLLAPYLNSTTFAQAKGKRFLMMETNSAACGGIVGDSDVFGAALWGLDYALQMAHSNFSGAMFHTGGQNVFYNVRLHQTFYKKLDRT
ncbi:hypothetical protein DFH06DRAFT_1209257 [Mycena polygramma]|nr:hypothetical protein DFH06DRAFT_1209257 [Mycena polygramma]